MKEKTQERMKTIIETREDGEFFGFRFGVWPRGCCGEGGSGCAFCHALAMIGALQVGYK